MSKNIFVVTSAIHSRFGIYKADERFVQTLNTLDSIRQRDPSAYIIISEASMERPINKDEQRELLQKADTIINLHQTKELQDAYKSTGNWDLVKNYSEMFATIKVFHYISTAGMGSVYDRVFKLSGRYSLTDKFDPEIYCGPDVKDKVVFGRRMRSQFAPAYTGGITEQFMCRLYSFPTTKIEDMTAVFINMLKVFVTNLNSNIYTDLEHSMFREFAGKPDTIELPVLGVRGFLGPNGMAVED